jgi:hypothetical protein
VTPVFQTIYGPGGNCYEACLASMLDLPLAEVPVFSGKDWSIRVREWLAELGRTIRFQPGNYEPLLKQPSPLAIVGLRTITGYVHSSLCEAGKIIHDPSPRRLSNPYFPVVLWSFIECPD